MKNQIIKKILLSFFIFYCFSSIAYADTTIHLNIKTPTSPFFDEDITVTPCDSDNMGTLQTTAYCAILQSGIPSVWDWSWAPGAFVTSINNIDGYTSKDKDENDVYHYWSWSLNGMEGATGLNQYELQPNDLINLDFIDPVEPIPEPNPTLSGSVGGSGSASCCATNFSNEITPTPTVKSIFDIKKAFEFLIAQQKNDGSWGENLYTDWTAIALASGNYQDQTIKLVTYFQKFENKNMLLTDYERHAMALMAFGLNPYNTNNENYIEKIIDSFDGKQFGDKDEDNDDIFALIVLQNAGYDQNEKIINEDVSFILGRQRENGSWDESIDMTGASIEALSTFSQNTDPLLTSPLTGGGIISNALTKAKEFLKQNQKDDGGWGNVSSTAWATEGILALNEKPEEWIPARNAFSMADAGGKNENTPLDYLATMQDIDGGIKNLPAEKEGDNMQNKIWETSYVVSVLSGKTWNQIMQKFDKPIIVETPKKISQKQKNTKIKLENLTNQNTATVINAIPSSPTETKLLETPKKNWFRKLLENIFGF